VAQTPQLNPVWECRLFAGGLLPKVTANSISESLRGMLGIAVWLKRTPT